MSHLSNNLKRLMGQASITASELARRTEIAQPIIHRLATGKNINPKIATISPIARYFTVTVSHLIGELPLSIDEGGDKLTADHRAWQNVPVISWQQSVQRHVDVFAKDNITPSFFVSTDASVSEDSYGLVIEQRSVAPQFPVGTTIVIDPKRNPDDQDFVVVRLGDSEVACLRQVIKDGDQVFLKPLNPLLSDVSTRQIGPNDQILGVMVQAKLNF